ncbi:MULTISPECIES: response regulator transcription factor [unclassified Frankia]|uniref:response regulator transcription factor n=1 Tax=unclassified Frankia TaxID=2632575 RepID=UPI0027DBD6D5|nr:MULTISPECIES: response regulator transcription factor [unclassified Frankia]
MPGVEYVSNGKYELRGPCRTPGGPNSKRETPPTREAQTDFSSPFQIDSGDPACPRDRVTELGGTVVIGAGVVTIRVVIADDHRIVRDGLRYLLGQEPDIEVVGEAGDGRQAVSVAAATRPAVVLLDLYMPC